MMEFKVKVVYCETDKNRSYEGQQVIFSDKPISLDGILMILRERYYPNYYVDSAVVNDKWQYKNGVWEEIK